MASTRSSAKTIRHLAGFTPVLLAVVPASSPQRTCPGSSTPSPATKISSPRTCWPSRSATARSPWSASRYYVGNLTNQDVGAYTRMDVRLGWRPTENMEFSVAGQNLFERRHREYGDGFFSVARQIPRSVYGKVNFRY